MTETRHSFGGEIATGDNSWEGLRRLASVIVCLFALWVLLSVMTGGVLADDDDAGGFEVEIEEIDLEIPDFSEPVLPPVEPVLSVSYAVENTGESDAEQEIAIEVEDESVETQTVALAPGERTTTVARTSSFEFPVDPDADDRSFTFNVSVLSEDDRDEKLVTIGEDSGFELGEIETNSPVEGEPLEARFEVTNTGDIVDFQTVTVDAEGLGTESGVVLLSPGESVTETVEIPTEAGDAGSYEVSVETADDTVVTEAAVRPADEEPFFAVEITDVELSPPTEPVLPPIEYDIEAEYRVENTGGIADAQNVTLSALEQDIATTTVDVDAGENVTGTLAGEFFPTVRSELTETCLPGEYCDPTIPITVASDDDADTQEIVPERPVENPEPLASGVTPQDLNGDGLHRDVTGDGQLSIADVQALFEAMDNPAIQDHAPAFNFAGVEPERVTIFDVQALFTDLDPAD